MNKEETQSQNNLIQQLVVLTEYLLTCRARRIARIKARIKARRKRLGAFRAVIMEWLDAFIWAVLMVLLLNQYLLQAYQIPSGSMRDTLIGGVNPRTGRADSNDRIFVDKLTFGPELIPGMAKLPSFRQARRSEIIIFENPEYTSPSTAHEIAQRVIYMATLSMIDLNRKDGRTAHQFLIKRQVAEDGDRVLFRHGKLWIQAMGENSLIIEADFKKYSELEYGNNLLLDPLYYKTIEASIKRFHLERAGLPVPRKILLESSSQWHSDLSKTILDPYEEQWVESDVLNTLYPQNEIVSNRSWRYRQGIYVPENWALPLGDNRSDSLDGRYFGPVPVRDILGRALFIYWPLNRSGIP